MCQVPGRIRFQGSGSDPGFSSIPGPDHGLKFLVSLAGLRFQGSGSDPGFSAIPGPDQGPKFLISQVDTGFKGQDQTQDFHQFKALIRG